MPNGHTHPRRLLLTVGADTSPPTDYGSSAIQATPETSERDPQKRKASLLLRGGAGDPKVSYQAIYKDEQLTSRQRVDPDKEIDLTKDDEGPRTVVVTFEYD
jgi:hypothetical protein